jgi:hypothetical protein
VVLLNSKLNKFFGGYKMKLEIEVIGFDNEGLIYDWDIVSQNELEIENYNDEMGVF